MRIPYKELKSKGLKFCPRCNLTKPRTEFRPRRSNEDYVNSYCAKCDKEYNDEQNSKKPSRQRVLQKRKLLEEGKQKCTLCQQIMSLENFSINKSSSTGYQWTCRKCTGIKSRLKIYKLSTDEYHAKLQSQNHICAICKLKEPLCIDHNRACCNSKTSCGNCVRGLLCITCNTLLGFSYDDVTILQSAISYLKEYRID